MRNQESEYNEQQSRRINEEMKRKGKRRVDQQNDIIIGTIVD